MLNSNMGNGYRNVRRSATILAVASVGALLLWPGFVAGMFATAGFDPHGECFLWNPGLVGTHVISDGIIGLSYMAISGNLAYLVYKARQDMPFHWVILSFGVFIVACGATHFIEILTIWSPVYWLSGVVKVITAAASISVALVMPPLVPRALGLISAAKRTEEQRVELIAANSALAQANRDLHAENTERRRAEQALRQSEEQLCTVVANADLILFAFDLEGKITLAEGRGLEAVGSAPGAMIGQSVFDIYKGQSELLSICQQALKGEADTGIYNFDGMILEYHLTPAHDETGRVTGATGVAIDVTEQKKAEAAIEQMNEKFEQRIVERTTSLEAAVKELEAFSYSISHDLRAPLRAVSGFSNALLQYHSGQLDAGAKRYLGLIKSNTVTMGQLIDDLLSFSRLNRQQMSQHPIDMTLLARSVIDDLSQTNPEQALSVSLGDLPSTVGDRAMIRQVLANLLSNAVKFTRNTQSAQIEVGSYHDENSNVYYVKDNGAGFDMQYAGKLFGVFQRLHSIKEFEGNGVGLALVQRIIQRHIGRVWGEGEVGKGATFYFTLPKAVTGRSLEQVQMPDVGSESLERSAGKIDDSHSLEPISATWSNAHDSVSISGVK